MKLDELSDEQLWQRLKDAEDEVFRIKMEIVARGRKEHPQLFDVIGTELRKALHTPGVMSYFVTEPKFVGKIPKRQDLPVEPRTAKAVKELRWKVELEILAPGLWDQETVHRHILARLGADEFPDVAEIVDSRLMWEEVKDR